jgi:hypothetical protein
METKFTPGPWSLELNGDYGDIRSTCARKWEIATVISSINKQGEPVSAESISNAHLIAASPDMLSALQAAIALADKNFTGVRTDECQAVYDQVKAAIDKATGQPHFPVTNP